MVRHPAPAALSALPGPPAASGPLAARVRQVRDSVLAWLLDRPPSGNVDQVARWMVDRWGDVARDVALARSAAETAGFFDTADTGFWSRVSRQIGQQGRR